MIYRIVVTYKGEPGYLRTEVTLDMKAHFQVVMNKDRAETFPNRARAERHLAKVIRLAGFDHAEIEEDEAGETRVF